MNVLLKPVGFHQRWIPNVIPSVDWKHRSTLSRQRHYRVVFASDKTAASENIPEAELYSEKTTTFENVPESELESSIQSSSELNFKTCGEAITAGLEFFQKERYSEALEAFNRSLELPGNGRFRFAGRAKEFSGPDESEEQSALYNMVCCYSKMGEYESALTCLEGLLEIGFDDFEALRKDPDLKELRSKDARLENLLAKSKSLPNKFFKMFQKDSNPNKPWFL